MEEVIEVLWQKGDLWRFLIMIFVTLGTHKQQFNRLLMEVDKLVERGKIKNVIAQIGYSTYIPKNYKWFKFLDFEKMLKVQKKAELIVTHAGVGSIMTALDIRKPIIVVPRVPKYNEHVDDHQTFTAKELENQGRVIAVYDIKNLGKAIERAKKFKPKIIKQKSRILDIVGDAIRKWENK